MLSKYLFEFIASFVFFGVILKYASRPDGPIIIGLTLAVAVFFGMIFGAGHCNPIVSTIMYLSDKSSMSDYAVFVLLQLLAGVLVWAVVKNNV